MTVWFSSVQESIYSARISLLPPLAKKITPFVCYALCLGHQHVLLGFTFLERVSMSHQKCDRKMKAATGTSNNIQTYEVTMHPGRITKTSEQLWPRLPDKAITLGRNTAVSMPLKRGCLAPFCFLLTLLKTKILEIRSFFSVQPLQNSHTFDL